MVLAFLHATRAFLVMSLIPQGICLLGICNGIFSRSYSFTTSLVGINAAIAGTSYKYLEVVWPSLSIFERKFYLQASNVSFSFPHHACYHHIWCSFPRRGVHESLQSVLVLRSLCDQRTGLHAFLLLYLFDRWLGMYLSVVIFVADTWETIWYSPINEVCGYWCGFYKQWMYFIKWDDFSFSNLPFSYMYTRMNVYNRCIYPKCFGIRRAFIPLFFFT